MLGPNTHAIGAVVRVAVGQTTMARLITAGVSFIGQEPAEAHFGVGPAGTVDSVTVEWPNGDVTVLENVEPNQVLTVIHALDLCYPDCDPNGVLDIFDFLCFQNSFVLGEPYACDCDPDPVCDIFDFLCFQNAFVVGCP